MANLPDTRHTEPGHGVEVHVAHAHNGGWDVIAMLDEQILATRHCDDWHRAERTYQRMKADLDRLVVLAGEAIAHSEDEHPFCRV